MAATSFATPMHGLANEQEISLSSNNIRDNLARGFLSASEDPRGSLLPTAVVGERQRIPGGRSVQFYGSFVGRKYIEHGHNSDAFMVCGLEAELNRLSPSASARG